MNQVPVKLGPLALLLTVISICLTTLSILTFTTAEADMRLAKRYAETVQVRYVLEKEGQEFLQEVKEALDREDDIFLEAYKTREKGIYENRLENGDTSLTVRLSLVGGEIRVLSWKLVRSWEEDTGIHVWDGMGWQ